VSRSRSGRTRELAVALFDVAWLLPRTIGAEERQADPLPRSELEVMRLLGRRPGTGVNAVAKELGLHPSNVSASIRSLVDRGLVERRASPDDRRQVLLVLTAAAQAAREERERRWATGLDLVLEELGDENRATILDALPALVRLAEQLGGPPVGHR